MAQDNKKRLLFLIDALKLPMTQEEAAASIEKLTPRQLELLVAMYEELKNYQDAIDRAAYEANPQEYEKLEAEYQADLEKIEDDYTEKLAQIEDETDREMEKIAKDTEDEEDKINSDYKSASGKILEGLKSAIPNS